MRGMARCTGTELERAVENSDRRASSISDLSLSKKGNLSRSRYRNTPWLIHCIAASEFAGIERNRQVLQPEP